MSIFQFCLNDNEGAESLPYEGIFFLPTGGYNCLNDDTAFLEMKHMANPLEHLSFNQAKRVPNQLPLRAIGEAANR
jgi:hypothetical protein